jgi:hypothetical protein
VISFIDRAVLAAAVKRGAAHYIEPTVLGQTAEIQALESSPADNMYWLARLCRLPNSPILLTHIASKENMK